MARINESDYKGRFDSKMGLLDDSKYNTLNRSKYKITPSPLINQDSGPRSIENEMLVNKNNNEWLNIDSNESKPNAKNMSASAFNTLSIEAATNLN